MSPTTGQDDEEKKRTCTICLETNIDCQVIQHIECKVALRLFIDQTDSNEANLVCPALSAMIVNSLTKFFMEKTSISGNNTSAASLGGLQLLDIARFSPSR